MTAGPDPEREEPRLGTAAAASGLAILGFLWAVVQLLLTLVFLGLDGDSGCELGDSRSAFVVVAALTFVCGFGALTLTMSGRFRTALVVVSVEALFVVAWFALNEGNLASCWG